MNRTLAKIYTLIMLECRLPLEEASQIFKVPKETLFRTIKVRTGYIQQYRYLEIECASYPEGFTKAKLKAGLYLRQLQRILKIQDKTERTRMLNDFITALSGPDISFAKTKNRNYTAEEREALIKHRIKYVIPGKVLEDSCNMSHYTVLNLDKNLPDDSELKIRLGILKKYLYLYYGYEEIKTTIKR